MNGPAILRVVAQRRGGRIARVEVLNRRTLAVGQLIGRTVDEARRLAPAFCGLSWRAQGEAVAAACRAARGEAPPVGEQAVLIERAVAAEAAQAHLWRLLLDWPPLYGHSIPRHRFAPLHRRLALLRSSQDAFGLGGELLDLVANELLAGFVWAMREPTTLAELVAMARRGGTVGGTLADLVDLGAYVPPDVARAPLLPTLPAARWAEVLGGMPAPAFCHNPAWDGWVCETGALARHAGSPLVDLLVEHGHPIAARLFARVVELGDCASRLRHPLPTDLPPLVDAAPLGPDCGLARVETASGLLLHAVRLEGERVADYLVVTPSDWNFQADGPLYREALGREDRDATAARLRIRSLALALDPGVAFEVALEEGGDGPEAAGDA
jgi:hypothetical protein